MPSLAQLPIGVFDSGLGGLTVLKALRESLPREDFVYLGDVARLPYGSKSQAVVQAYARSCVKFLLDQPVKAVVIACNTASAMALETLKLEFELPLFGVIESGVLAGVSGCGPKRSVLVLGTEATVRSEAYLKGFNRLAPDIRVVQLSCPLLVALAEEGWFDHSVTETVIRHYLSSVDLSSFGAVVLGCTHFPLLAPSFRRVLPPDIALTHGAGFLAQQVQTELGRRNEIGHSEAPQVTLLATDRIQLKPALLEGWFANASEFQVVSSLSGGPVA
jgi:glutamate racemase